MVALRLLFVLHRPLDYALKPLLLGLLINAAWLAALYFGHGSDPAVLWGYPGLLALGLFPILLGCCAVVTYLFHLQQQRTRRTMTDALTGLPNRRAFLEQAKIHFINDHKGYLLAVDVDHFKQINDHFGQRVGDICLIGIADRLRTVMGPDGLVARIEGAAFVAYVSNCQKTQLVRLGHKLTETIPVEVLGLAGPIRITLSIGVAEAGWMEQVENAMARAEAALFHAKRTGRARMVVGPRPAPVEAA